MTETYLYIYRNDARRQVYIGIGASPARAWEKHSPAAQELLNDDNTKVLITADPFPDRISAERAEAAAICAAAAAGVAVLAEREDLASLTNIAKVSSSKHMVPALYQQEGTIKYDDLEKTAIVILRLDQISDSEGNVIRPTINGGRSDKIIEERATRYWPLREATRRRAEAALSNGSLPRDVDQLIAVQKGAHTIIGAWKLTEQQWRNTSEGWEFCIDEAIPDSRGKWFDWCGAHPSNGVTWSRDIRKRIANSTRRGK